MRQHVLPSTLLALLCFALPASADVATAQPEPDTEDAETVTYRPDFFARYRPVSALDMVENLPGFRLDDGSSSRGFGAAAGNVLVNSKRPSTKQDRVSSFLERIPASRVERIDLIRGDTGALPVGEQSVVANVILSGDGRATWTWQTRAELDLDRGGPEPGGSLSMVNRSGQTRYGLGVNGRHYFVGNRAAELLLDDSRTLELRDEFERYRGNDLSLNFNTETTLPGALVHFNGEIEYGDQDFRERSTRHPPDLPEQARDVIQTSVRDTRAVEVGGDVAWPLSATLDAKAIALFASELQDRDRGLDRLDTEGDPEQRQRARTEKFESETIARFELDWTAWADHHVEFDIETAVNVLDNELELVADTGGGFEPVPVPNADLRIEERRADVALSDSWRLGPVTLESAVGAEASRISQNGDGSPPRSFFYIKPSLGVTHAPGPATQN
ncbi:MAG: hypothetical protein ACOCSR_05215, partial [Wenzhouxiangella sp.]